MAAKAQRWTSCNVLAPAGDGRVLWSFGRKGDDAALAAEQTVARDARLPADRVAKTIRHTWQPRLNIAWLPSDKVFLRVVELPPSDPAEVPALIEFQLEKLSPLPASQTVWTYELLPAAAGEPLTAVVALTDRAAVEERLNDLESVGYRADRLDLPLLRELLALKPRSDGITLLAGIEGGQLVTLTSWWSAGRLRHLSLGRFVNDPGAAGRVAETFRRTLWSAEVEGWLPDYLQATLVAEPAVATTLEPPLRELTGHAVEIQERLAPAKLAAVTATARAQANLIPPEIRARHRQEFVDRIWMRALGGLALAYVFGVLIFFAILSVQDYRKSKVDHQVALLTDKQLKAKQLRDRVDILQEQVNLKFAALDSWKAAAEALPEGMTLNSITFQRGKKLGLMGSVPVDQQGKVTEYNEALAKAAISGKPLFSKVTTKSIQAPPAARQDQPAIWNLECELNRTDAP